MVWEVAWLPSPAGGYRCLAIPVCPHGPPSSRHLCPILPKPQATVLALWSLGMALARSCALTAVSGCLATWLHRKEEAVRQRWREVCYEAAAKRGTAREALRAETCCMPLLAWSVSWWQGTPLALALSRRRPWAAA